MTEQVPSTSEAAAQQPAPFVLPARLGPVLDRLCAALAHPLRRSIFSLLGQRGELSAGELARVFPQVTRQAVSAHLQVLLKAGLLRGRQRRRHWVDRRDSPERRVLAGFDALSTHGSAVYYSQDPELLGLLWLWLRHEAPSAASSGKPPILDGSD